MAERAGRAYGRGMTWIRCASALATGVVGIASLIVATPNADAAPDGYHGYVACSTRSSAKPTHECKLSQTKAAFFVSSKHDATFKVCVKYPKGERLCASDQPAPKGTKHFVTIATASTGRHKVWWYVGGKKVESWTFTVTDG
jgi:hypothetical protein